jgi:Class III cytochrome C family
VTRRWVLALITANLLGLIALVFLYPDFMIGPGPLTPAHANLSTDCFACHAPLRGATSERCVSCHVISDIGLRTTRGAPVASAGAKVAFHQKLSTQDCMSCHTGHQGSALALATSKSFSHELLLPAARAKCATCHTPTDTTIHRGMSANCGQCHSQQAWKPATFDHDKLFSLDGDHNVACATCHPGNDTRRFTCYGCHEHQPDGIRAKHLDEGISNFENCVQCHRSAHDKHGSGERGKDD